MSGPANSSGLKPVSNRTQEVFLKNREQIIENTVRESIRNTSETGIPMETMERKVRNGFEMVHKILYSIMEFGSAALLTDQLDWAEKRLPHEGISPEQVLQDIKIFRKVTEKTVSEVQFSEIAPYFDFLIRGQEKIIGKNSR